MLENFPLGVKFRYESIPLLWVLEDVYTKDECQGFINRIEASNPQLATNNPIYRDQDRVIVDDSSVASDLFNRIKNDLPERIENFKLSCLNERLRFYRYAEGQRFSPHMDHWYQADEKAITLLTVIAYFNGDFIGGETRFMEQVACVIVPEHGKVAIFQHKVRHEGCIVRSGRKYAMRTDVIYEKQG